MEKFFCDNNEQTVLKILKANKVVYHHYCVSNNQQKLNRYLEKRQRDDDTQKEAKVNKRCKRTDMRHHRSFW